MLTQVLEQILCAIHTSGKTSSMTICYTLKSTDYRLPGMSQAHSFNEFDWDQNEKHCWPDATDLDGVCWADIHVTPLTPAVHHTCSSSTHTGTPVRQWCVQIYGQNVVSHHVESLWGWLWKSVRVCACVCMYTRLRKWVISCIVRYVCCATTHRQTSCCCRPLALLTVKGINTHTCSNRRVITHTPTHAIALKHTLSALSICNYIRDKHVDR